MSIKHHLSFTRTAVAALLAASITGCGSDGGGTSSTTIDGSVFASYVNGATCGIYSDPNVIIGSTFTTSETGTFSVSIPDGMLANDLALVCDGGTYIDEVDGSTQTAGTMAAYVQGGTLAAGVSFNATPGSSIIFHLITDYNMSLAEAEAAFEPAFGYVPDVTVMPTDATNPASGSSLAALQAGLHAAAFSQLTKGLILNQNQQFAVLDALVADLSDGILDGLASSAPIPLYLGYLPVSISNYVDSAATNFRTSSASASYNFTYSSQMMMDTEGKNTFQVNITDFGGTPVSGQNVTVMPMMYMASKTHSAAVDGPCVETVPGTSGIYDCTVYYSMGSRMMDGSSMGEWDLKIMVGGMMGESAHFYPEVMMAMGDTKLAKLKNSGDTITNMEGVATARNFLLYRSALSFNLLSSTYTLELFTATMESMMSFPAVTSTTSLNSGTMNQLDIVSMEITASTDPAFGTFVTATENGNGYWTLDGINIAKAAPGNIYVRMKINGLTYNSSIDGVFVDEATTPTHATFAINASLPM